MSDDCPSTENRPKWTLEAYIVHAEALHEADAKLQDARFLAAGTAVSAALAAQEKAVNAAFAASEKSNEKTEEAQRAYNASHNDLTRKMDNQYERMMPRTEALDKIDNLKKEIAELRESRSEVSGKSRGLDAGVAMFIAVAGLLFGLIGAVGTAFGIYLVLHRG